MRIRVECGCGRSVTANTFKSHIKSHRCTADSTYKTSTKKLLDLQTRNHRAWLRSEGAEARSNTNWITSILSGETALEQWTFTPPRKQGENTPSIYLRNSIERKGSQNPAVRAKILPTKPNIEKFIKDEWPKWLADPTRSIGDFWNTIDSGLLNWAYAYADTDNSGRNSNKKRREIIYSILGVDPKSMRQILWDRRGLRISVGQKASPRFREMASRMALGMRSSWKVSIPHRALFCLVRTLDPLAEMEFRVKIIDHWRAFDIYSPAVNSFIEMHGRVWHDPTNSRKIGPVTDANYLNDRRKEEYAKDCGKDYVVFWDDELHCWADRLLKLYGTKPTISTEEAFNQISRNSRYARRLRRYDAQTS